MRLLEVNVGLPTPLHDDRTGREVMSGIGKRPVGVSEVEVGRFNIAGDGQADLVNHGGADKAIYCYPHDHLPAWDAEVGYGTGIPAPFGENLSVLPAWIDIQLLPMENPALFAVPVGFVCAVVGSLLSSERDTARFTELRVRSLTGWGADREPT